MNPDLTYLYNVAKQEAIESLQLVENIVQTIGWTLNYQAITIDQSSKPLIEK